MIRMMVGLATLVLVGLVPTDVRAQDPRGMPLSVDGAIGPPAAVDASVPLGEHDACPPKHGLSQWITGTDPDCCGPLGDHNPMQTELYLRSGLVFTSGHGQMADSLQDGWRIEGGARA